MNILVACEKSQRVCAAFRAKGHTAYSCDIDPAEGGKPEWHIKGDVMPLLDGGCEFKTQDGTIHFIPGRWDIIIAHPPCTYLAVSGNAWYNVERYGDKAVERLKRRQEAIAFFMEIANAKCDRIAIENPVGVMSSSFRKPDQIIQPWQFAFLDDELTEKSTCLWLKNLPCLVPLNTKKPQIQYHEWFTADGRRKRQNMWFYGTRCLPQNQRAWAASKTFLGIASAMAEQWG